MNNTTLRDVQLCELEILKEVVRICDKYRLTYYLAYGTLLGAVRHKGFIPWDDDIDISMPVKDYKKFIAVAKKEMHPDFFLQTFFTDLGFECLWTKVRKNGTTSLPISMIGRKIHYGICIDIFPIIRCAPNVYMARIKDSIFRLCSILIRDKNFIAKDDASFKYRILWTIPYRIRLYLCRLLMELIYINIHKNSKYYVLGAAAVEESRELDASCLKPEDVIFENCHFKATSNRDLLLQKLYGNFMDYPPEEERNGHEFSLGKIIYDTKIDYSQYMDDLIDVC